ncbi:hypothetical protein [Staphylococcus americanisciuri]|uniref:Uncharacterized protein n=1 Tax=Staphylococcus americanisciuri TaxID=2973940 RepID=A0ABT2EZM6_9STAP|nr:hypothetical protein [Staphylococcus americanisciuri]MCS4485658.1 hypothetical protein [Staphylococcus americanisciuri]
MSELIPFPKTKEKLVNDIKQAVAQSHYEQAYDAFMTYEKYFELTNELALLKCHVLWELAAFLELREETHILIKQEFQPQDDLMIYHLQSLYALEQYQTVVNIIDKVFENNARQEMRMALLPIKDQAQRQLKERRTEMQSQLQKFEQLSKPRQMELILSLIDDGADHFASTIAYLLVQNNVGATLQSLMLEYLRYARYNQSIPIQKYGRNIEVIPSQLIGMEATHFITVITPKIIDMLEVQHPSLVHEALTHLNAHNIDLYPIDITDIASDQAWIDTYMSYFEDMLGIPSTYGIDEAVGDMINLINRSKST